MSVKQKILGALDCALDDISEELLIEILVNAYNQQKRRIDELGAENVRERERLLHEHEMMRRERDTMRREPLYCAAGDYFFECNERWFQVNVQGYRMQLMERKAGFMFAGRPVPREEWIK